MKGHMLRDKEVEEEAKKGEKSKDRRPMDRGGVGNVRRMADSSGSGQSLFQDQPIKEELDLPWSVKFERFFGHARLPDADGTPS